MAAPGSFVTTAQAARYLGVTKVTIQRWVRSGVITAEKLPGQTGAYVIDRIEIERIRARRAAGWRTSA